MVKEPGTRDAGSVDKIYRRHIGPRESDGRSRAAIFVLGAGRGDLVIGRCNNQIAWRVHSVRRQAKPSRRRNRFGQVGPVNIVDGNAEISRYGLQACRLIQHFPVHRRRSPACIAVELDFRLRANSGEYDRVIRITRRNAGHGGSEHDRNAVHRADVVVSGDGANNRRSATGSDHGCSICGDDERSHDSFVICLPARIQRQIGLNFARLLLQHPVPAERRIAGHIGRAGHVGTSKL